MAKKNNIPHITSYTLKHLPDQASQVINQLIDAVNELRNGA